MPTIAAIATAPGKGGISIIRLSGPGSKPLLSRVFLPHSPNFDNFRPWTLHHGILLGADDNPLDDVLAVYMPGPKTYSGEDMAEIHCHGGNAMAQAALDSLLRIGARLANPGEFSRRAFLNGRMDLSQAEAVAELIAAPSAEALANGLARLEGALSRKVKQLKEILDELRALARLGVDFPDEEIEGLPPEEFEAKLQPVLQTLDELLAGAKRARLLEEGCSIIIAGNVNVGKSSLLNIIAGRERALVTDIPGTTRDFIEERLDFNGLPVRLIDTAGLRHQGDDLVENLGMERSLGLMAEADLVVVVLDAANPGDPISLENIQQGKGLLVWNKIDLQAPGPKPHWAPDWPIMAVSAKTGENVDNLIQCMRDMLLDSAGASGMEISAPPNRRQAQALEIARKELLELSRDLRDNAPPDCCLARLDTAAQSIMEVVELAPDSELLDKIFSQFCIGK